MSRRPGVCKVWRGSVVVSSMMAATTKLTLALTLLGTIAATGCGSTRIALTKELREQHELSDAELKRLQYYVSDDIVLRREVRRDAREIDGHALRLTSGKLVEEIEVPEGTPGIAVAVEGDRLEISFQPGTSLVFSLDGSGPSQGVAVQEPNPFPGSIDGDGFAQPPGSSGSSLGGRYWLSVESDAGLMFAGRRFRAVEESLAAHLLIDAEELDEAIEDRTVLGGRTL